MPTWKRGGPLAPGGRWTAHGWRLDERVSSRSRWQVDCARLERGVIVLQVAGGCAALEHGGVALRVTGLLPPSGVRSLRLVHVAGGPMQELGFSIRPRVLGPAQIC